MASPLTQLLRCPEPGCDFTYTADNPGPYRHHRTGVHVGIAKVTYSNHKEDIVLVRKDKNFQCIRCSFASPHPNVMQVR